MVNFFQDFLRCFIPDQFLLVLRKTDLSKETNLCEQIANFSYLKAILDQRFEMRNNDGNLRFQELIKKFKCNTCLVLNREKERKNKIIITYLTILVTLTRASKLLTKH